MGIITGNFLVGGKKKAKQNTQKIASKGVTGRSLSRKKIPGVTPFWEDRKDNSSPQEASSRAANKLGSQWRSPFPGIF